MFNIKVVSMPEKKCPLNQINVFRLTSLYISLFSFSTIRCVILINDKVNLLCVIDHKYMSILQNISIVKPVPPDLLVCLYSVACIYSFFLCLHAWFFPLKGRVVEHIFLVKKKMLKIHYLKFIFEININ